MKKTILTLTLVTGVFFLSNGQSRIYVNEYLNIGVGAQALGMGGAMSAGSRDVYSGYYNPAGLTRIQEDLQVGLMHAEYFAGNAKYDFASVAMPTKDKKRVFGISLLRFATDDIPYTIDYIQPDGSFDESKLKSISAGDYAFLISYAQQIKLFKNTEIKTSIGGNAKMVYRNIGSMASAWGGGADLGIQALYRKWHFGITAKDITTTYTTWTFNLTEKEKEIFGKTGNEIPVKSFEVMNPRFIIGAAYQFFKAENKIHLLAEINTDLTTDGKRSSLIRGKTISIDPRVGLEADYKRTIFLRAGVSNIQRVLNDNDSLNKEKFTIFQPSIGIGLKLGPLNVDYAYTSLQTQSNPLFSHIVSLRGDVVRLVKKKNKQEESN